MKDRSLVIDGLLSKADNKFLLSNAVSGRAKQIAEGSLPYVNDFDPTDPIVTALKEIAANKILIKIGDGSRKKAAPLVIAEPEKRRERPSVLESLARTAKKKSPEKKNKKKK